MRASIDYRRSWRPLTLKMPLAELREHVEWLEEMAHLRTVVRGTGAPSLTASTHLGFLTGRDGSGVPRGVTGGGVALVLAPGCSTATGACNVLRAVPIDRDQANAYVARFHRHSKKKLPVTRFQVACADETGLIRGVAIAGNPKARALDGGWELEVNRVCTDGYRNACSFLYARCVHFARAAGFSDLYTYITDKETGASLKASGWVLEAETEARDWALERGAGRTASGGPRKRWRIRLAEPMEVRWPAEFIAELPPTLWEGVAA